MPNGKLSVTHYRAVHRHLFQDIYAWAGEYRTVRIAKGKSLFCFPENIASEMRGLFADFRNAQCLRGTTRKEFASGAAHFLATLNAIHPFREGNGRAQLTFIVMLAEQAGHRLDLDRLVPDAFLRAMIWSFDGDEKPLTAALEKLLD